MSGYREDRRRSRSPERDRRRNRSRSRDRERSNAGRDRSQGGRERFSRCGAFEKGLRAYIPASRADDDRKDVELSRRDLGREEDSR